MAKTRVDNVMLRFRPQETEAIRAAKAASPTGAWTPMATWLRELVMRNVQEGSVALKRPTRRRASRGAKK